MKLRMIGLSLLLMVFLFFLSMTQFTLAGTVGKISGVVTDEKGEPLPGVSVRIENTSIGAAAQFDGSYVILNVPPGTYILTAQTVGYNKMTVQDVEVQVDVTTEQNFKLTSNAIKVEDVVVVKEKKDIDKYITQTEDKFSSEKIKTLPVSNVNDILRLAPGLVRQGGVFHARGGRGGEIAFIIDGIQVKDPLGGPGQSLRQNVDVSATDIEEVSLLKGNYDAEYGDVNSAIVNVVRKEGSVRTTSGRIEFLTDDLGFSDLNKYSFNSDRLEWNLSGPLPALSDQLFPALGMKWPGEKMAYFVSFSVDKSNNYVDYNNNSSPNSKIDYGEEEFLGIKIPDRRSNQYAASGKLTWKMDSNARYRMSINYWKQWQRFTGYSYEFLYSPESAPKEKESKEIYGVTFSFSPPFLKNTTGEFKLNRYIQIFEEDPGDRDPGDFLNSDYYESFTDVNQNGRWDQNEPFVDVNGDGFFGEPFVDNNNNGVYDADYDYYFPDSMVWNGTDSVYVFDLNGNHVYDGDIGEPYSDANNNGAWDPSEPISNDYYFFDYNGNGVFDNAGDRFTDTNGNGRREDNEPFEDLNDNGEYDAGDFAYLIDGIGNGVYDPQLHDVTNIDVAEPYTDGDISLGEPYVDANLNGQYDPPDGDPNTPDDIFKGAWDLNGNGQHDSDADSVWTPGIPFRDLNNNGTYDAPNGSYDYGEPFVDQNGNGIWDNKDGFWDYGYDQWALYNKTKSVTNTFSLNLTSQVAKQHEIKSGLEFKDLTLEMNEVQYPDQTYDGQDDGGDWPDRGVFRDFYVRTPKQGAFYFRDKMEYGEMIANLGFRYEFYLQATEVKGVEYSSQSLQGQNILDSRNKFSPRVSFSFPVSDKAKLYFNYGHIYQLPEMRYFYRRPTQASSAAGIIGNPNLDFQKTIQYELGVQYSIARGYVMNLSGFYKDYYGLLNSIQKIYGPITTDVYGNIDYARTRGLEMELEKRYGNFFAGSLDYQFTWAFGKNSTESADYFARFYRQEIPIQERPLDWDIRHQVTINGDLRAAKDQHPQFGIFRLPDDWSFNFIWQFKTGRPFTPNASYPGLVLVGRESPLSNSKRMGFYSTVDIRLDKNYQAWKLNYTLSLRVENLFDTKNVNTVYEKTGLAYTDQNFNGQILSGLPQDANPANYDPGRQISIGLSMNF